MNQPLPQAGSPGLRTADLVLRPLHEDPQPAGTQPDEPLWTSRTDDPAFLAAVQPGEPPLESGWYRATVTLDRRSGELRRPQIYIPDAAGHYAEERSVVLLKVGKQHEADFFLPASAEAIRFDPTQAPCEFACKGLRLTALGGGDNTPRPDRGPYQDRKSYVLSTIDREGVGIEIGASHDPIAPKRDGFKVHVIDHASREELRAKYERHGVDLERIEEVDFVWHGESYLELTGRPRHYDWIIASHVIEHTPDLIGFLNDCDSILKDDGVLSLVVPDKRFCFDRFRPITGLARIVDSHVGGHKIHSPGAVAEYILNVANKGGQGSWNAGLPGDYAFFHSARQAGEAMRHVRENSAYVDIHNWCFVPHSFRLLLDDLHTLGYTPLREVEFHPTEGFEFYVTLGRRGGGPRMSRLDLLRQIDREQAAVDP